jgi:hypothetical protein
VAPVESFVVPRITRRRRQRLVTAAGIILAGALSTGIVLMSIWLLTLAQ